ncbi:DUF5719 family protein [Kitasatospora sp. NBC_01250]|uniref:DUF5719 family protein n=1 Tax=unclassified Kitasatospora TaxID=2633591 RepID=UPI002E1155D7|nr:MULTISPECIES: DUF5719 family protein [unclassified Kitasatospora]WSJ67519.1 DUF5719 family protein [Kitasatospora sp. NBC_01302]
MKLPAFSRGRSADEPSGPAESAEPAGFPPPTGHTPPAGTPIATPAGPGGSRAGVSLLACAAVLGLVFGVAELRPPASPAGPPAGAPVGAQVERTAVICPQPIQGVTGSTQITAFTPGSGGPAQGGSATVRDVTPPAPAAAGPSGAPSGSPAASPSPSQAQNTGQANALVTLAKPGVPVSAQADNGDSAVGTTAIATGSYAPGFTVTQTTTVTDPHGQGLSAVNCTPSGTHFWFAGASTAGDRKDYVSLTNPDATAAVVDLRLYGGNGPIDSDAATGITVPPGSSVAVLLTSVVTDQVSDLAVEVSVRSGRVGAFLHAADGSAGADWIPASVDPAASVTIPGLPGDLSAARLIVAAPGGSDDADLKVQLSGPNGWFTPAGHETIHVKAGMVNAVDLGQITRQQASALRLTPSDPQHPTPVVATMRVDRSANGKSDSAWLTGTDPVGRRASVADTRGGGTSTLLLTATGDAATVKVTASAGTGGGTPNTQTVQVPAGSTISLASPEPAGGSGSFGLTMESVSGGPVVAARVLAVSSNNVPMFTIQALHDDHSYVQIPQANPDPGVLVH